MITNKLCAVYTCRNELRSLPYVNNAIIDYYDYPDDDIFLKSQYKFKIAIFEIDYVNYEQNNIQFEKFKNCDYVLIFSMEGTSNVIDLIKKYDLPNFIFVVNCYLNFKFTHAQIKHVTPHLNTVSYLWQNKNQSLTIDKLTPYQKKPYHFEIMYGQRRKHRTHVANWILENNLTSYFLQTPYFSKNTRNNINATYNLDNLDFWEDEMIPSANRDYICTYSGIEMLISQVMPFKIYQQSAFSLVCESATDDRGSFFTEKIAKPIIASRLFVVISGQYYLKNLKNLGFKTFDGIIDESYDSESDPEKRWNLALEQVKWLCTQDQNKILKAIIPTVLHNQNLITKLPSNVVEITLQKLLLEHQISCH